MFWTSLPSDIALRASCQFSGIFSKRLQVCLAIILKTEWADTALSVQQFLAKNKMVVVSHPLYSPDLASCDFFCTHGWSRFWNGGVLLTLQRFNENRWRSLTAFLLKILDKVSRSGSIAGIAASSHRGSTLKGTKISNMYEYFNKFV